jgi:hypothetical protein
VHTLALAQHAIGDDDHSAPLSTPIQLLTDVSSIHCRRFQTLRFQTKYLHSFVMVFPSLMDVGRHGATFVFKRCQVPTVAAGSVRVEPGEMDVKLGGEPPRCGITLGLNAKRS